MKYKLTIAMAMLLTITGSTVFAGSESKVGTAGAQELLIPVGTRGVAMGGAVVANPIGLESIYWNPAGLTSIEGTETIFSYQPYLADMEMNFFGVATSIESFGTLGASARVLSVGDIEETTESQPEGTGRVYSPTLSAITVSYAKDLTASVALGANVSFLHESIFEVSASGLSFDFGVTYRPQWRGLTMGIAIKNFGPKMKFSGPGFDRRFEEGGQRTYSPKSADFDLPSSINLGLAYTLYNEGMNSVTAMGNYNANNFSTDVWQGGAEYSYNNRYFLRAGYNMAASTGDADNLYGFALGAGLEYPMGNTTLKVGYAWNQTEVFDDNQYFSVGLNF